MVAGHQGGAVQGPVPAGHEVSLAASAEEKLGTLTGVRIGSVRVVMTWAHVLFLLILVVIIITRTTSITILFLASIAQVLRIAGRCHWLRCGGGGGRRGKGDNSSLCGVILNAAFLNILIIRLQALGLPDQLIVERPHEGELVRSTESLEVIRLYGPDHHPAQPLLPGKVGLEPDAPLVVVAEPHVVSEHEGGAVLLLPLHTPPRPRARVLNLLLADLIVTQEAVLASVWALEMRQSNYVLRPNKQTMGMCGYCG